MFGKAFASMYTGSMMGAGAHVFAVWTYAIANAGRNHAVHLNPDHLAMVIGMTVDEAKTALEFLLSPDPKSQSPAEDGRRLRHDGGYWYSLVNGPHYRGIRDEADRREYFRVKKQESRERQKQKAGAAVVAGSVTPTAEEPPGPGAPDADGSDHDGDPLGLTGPRR